jgi:PAS domain S-box-containing protein
MPNSSAVCTPVDIAGPNSPDRFRKPASAFNPYPQHGKKPMKKILVIGADDATCNAMRSFLEAENCEVEAAAGAMNGLVRVEELCPRIVFAGVGGTEENAMGIVGSIKSLDPDAEVIVVTDRQDPDLPDRAFSAGASDCIAGPVNGFALKAALRRSEEREWLRSRLDEAVEEIQKLHDLEHKLIHTSMDGIVANDRRGNIIVFNQGASRIYGYEREEVLGRMHAEDLYYDEGEARKVKKKIHGPEYGGPGRLINYETRIRNKEGNPVPALLSATLIYEHGEEIATVGYFKDLEEIERLQRDLVRKSRLAAVGEAMLGVTHRVKNILHAMQLGAFIVEDGIERGNMELVRRGWRMVRHNMQHISNFNLDMIRYSQKEDLKSSKVDLNALLRAVCDSVAAAAARHGVEVRFRPEADLPMISADPGRLRDCARKLVTNALEAFPEGSGDARVEVRTGRAAEEGRVRFEVADNGTGMSPKVLERIFQPLFSTKRARGTGLGLTIVERTIAEHGGSIEVASEPGSGTTFTVILPVETGAGAAPSPKLDPADADL